MNEEYGKSIKELNENIKILIDLVKLKLNTQHKRKLKVLSLCDGISIGQLALTELGYDVEYYASEIKDIALKVTKNNFPNTIHIGDVNKIHFKDGILTTETGDYCIGKFDLVMFGSPCQTFSIAIPADKRIGMDNKEKSGLFLECYRILKETNPTYFLMENVASMKKEDKQTISKMMGVEPIQIDSKLVAPALRKRLYWTNIPDIVQPLDKGISLQSILEDGYTDRDKARCLAVIDSRPNSTPIKMFHRYYSTGFTTLIFKDKNHYEQCKEYYDLYYKGMSAEEIDLNTVPNIFDGVRYMTQSELEKCQTVPQGYTKILTRNEAADVLGDGWTLDIIKHILSYMKFF